MVTASTYFMSRNSSGGLEAFSTNGGCGEVIIDRMLHNMKTWSDVRTRYDT